MVRRSVWILVGLIAVSVLSGCGEEDKKKTTTPASVATTSTSVTTATTTPTTVAPTTATKATTATTKPPTTQTTQPTTSATVKGGAFCSPEGATGKSSAGNTLVCKPGSDGKNRWQLP